MLSQSHLRLIRLTPDLSVLELTRVFMTLVLLLSIVNLSMFSGRFRFRSKTLQSYKLFLTWQNFSPFFFLSFSYFAVIRTSIRKASAKLHTLFVSAKFLYIYFYHKIPSQAQPSIIQQNKISEYLLLHIPNFQMETGLTKTTQPIVV